MTGIPIGKRRLLFVGGKGGVGKTTTAAAVAIKLAETGGRTLVVSTDPAHSLGDLFDRNIGDEEQELLPGVWGMEVDPDDEVDRYLESVKRTMRDFVRPGMYPEIERQMELTRQSPGASEAAMMERVATLMQEGGATFERVIFDTAPTGHTLRLLSLPEIMAAWMDGLLRSRDRSDSFGRAVERLTGRKVRREGSEDVDEPASTGEPSHGTEGEGEEHTEEEEKRPSADELSWFQEADDAPADERGRRIREILLARRRTFAQARRLLLDREKTAFIMVLIPEKLPILETQKALEALSRHRIPIAGLVVNRVLPDGPLGEFLERRREQESEYLERIDRLFADYPRIRVPLLQRDVDGVESLREVGRYLEVEG